VQGTRDNITGCRGARLLVWLILNDRVLPSFIAGVYREGRLDTHTPPGNICPAYGWRVLHGGVNANRDCWGAEVRLGEIDAYSALQRDRRSRGSEK
jgi:hypothetical protein